MKRVIISIILTLVIFLTNLGQVQAQIVQVIIGKFQVNSYMWEDIYTMARDMDAAPFINNGRVFIPVRYLGYALGLSDNNMCYNANLQSVGMAKGDTAIGLTVGSPSMLINNNQLYMDVAPVIRNDRVFLPARYVAEAFGANVSWDPQKQIITITRDFDNTPYEKPSNGGEQLPTPDYTTNKDAVEPPYIWKYNGSTWSWDPKHPLSMCDKIISYYRKMPHPVYSDYDYMQTYCVETEQVEKDALQNITNIFVRAADKNNYDEAEMIGLAVAFVQSFTYTDDLSSTGYVEYPRYPLETLIERKGDCEDFSILTACLIRDLGYNTALIIFDGKPGHCAVGVACNNNWPGAYYDVNGKRYYYLETTDKGWEIGEVPDDFAGVNAKVFPLP